MLQCCSVAVLQCYSTTALQCYTNPTSKEVQPSVEFRYKSAYNVDSEAVQHKDSILARALLIIVGIALLTCFV